MVEFTPDNWVNAESFPEQFWKESGYEFQEGQLWEPTLDSFEDYRDSHEKLVSNMLNFGLGDILDNESSVPEIFVTPVSNAIIRGFPEPNLVQRIGMNRETGWKSTLISVSYDLIRPEELPDFNIDPAAHITTDVVKGKLHTAKMNITIPFDNSGIKIGYTGFPVLNRGWNELSKRVFESHTITNIDSPFMGIKNEETEIMLSQVAAYFGHFANTEKR